MKDDTSSTKFKVGDIVRIRTINGDNVEISGFHPIHANRLARCAWFDRHKKFHEIYVNVGDLILVNRKDKTILKKETESGRTQVRDELRGNDRSHAISTTTDSKSDPIVHEHGRQTK